MVKVNGHAGFQVTPFFSSGLFGGNVVTATIHAGLSGLWVVRTGK